jgi:hypothetical protein
MMATITKPLQEIFISDLGLAISYLQGTIDSAAKRIDAGNESALEIQRAQTFAIAGLRALSQS